MAPGTLKKKCILLRILGGECLKAAATTTVSDNSRALAGRQQSFRSDAKQELTKTSGHTTVLMCLAATFAKAAVWCCNLSRPQCGSSFYSSVMFTKNYLDAAADLTS